MQINFSGVVLASSTKNPEPGWRFGGKEVS